jgi:hypothetical protein
MGSLNVVAGTTGKFAGLASVRLAGVGSVTVVTGAIGEGGDVAYLFVVNSVTVVAFMIGKGAGLESVRSVGLGSISHCGGWHDW